MQGLDISLEDRKVYLACKKKEEKTKVPCSAIQLSDGAIITGKTSDLFESQSAMILNALKYLAGIPDEEKILEPETIVPITELKVKYLSSITPRLHIDETLIALSSSSATNEKAKLALNELPKLKGAEVHSSILLPHIDGKMCRKLGINLTSSPIYEDKIPKY
jgi:uncharacterized protein (UPF0371 family)